MADSVFLAGIASVSASLADPLGSNPLVAAVQWLEGTLLGTIARTVAILAVASVGFLLLTGRVQVRHGATVIAGCFILFGAASIVAGFQAAISGGELAPAPVVAETAPVAIPPNLPRDDPYAGASLQRR